MWHENVMQIGAKGAEYIADTLKYNNTITILDLRGNGLRDEVRASQFRSFYHLFCHSSHSFLLFLFFIYIKCFQGAMCLARSLKVVNEVLTELDLGFNEIRVRNCYFIESVHRLKTSCTILYWFCVQDDGAFAIAQALKANEDVKITSLNLANNFLTKFGQVILLPLILIHGFFFFFQFCLLLVHMLDYIHSTECSHWCKRSCIRDEWDGSEHCFLEKLNSLYREVVFVICKNMTSCSFSRILPADIGEN